MKDALRRLEQAAEVPLVAFVGDISRTWYVDIDVLGCVMEILRECRLYRPVRGGPWGFDLRVGEISAALGLVEVTIDPLDSSRGRYIHDPGMLDGCCMLVVFPMEGSYEVDEFGKKVKGAVPKQGTWDKADPPVTQVAIDMRIPVLIVRRSGATEWIGWDE